MENELEFNAARAEIQRAMRTLREAVKAYESGNVWCATRDAKVAIADINRFINILNGKRPIRV